jgi:nucleotide-binding universal stress UspA family protein
MVRNIIVPLDQSHVAECAIPYARALARRTDARVTLLTAMESSSSLPEPPPEDDLPPVEERPLTPTERRYSASMPIGFNPGAAELTEEELEEITEALKEKEDYLTYIGDSITEAPVEKKIVYGDPVDQIVKAGRERDGDPASTPVIVVASHGRSGLGRILLGSVALKVAERATCPMLIVRALSEPIPSVSEISLGKVLIALDGSRFSEAVLDPVRRMLGHEGTSIHLLRVVELDRSWVTGEPAKQDAEGRTARDDAEQYLSSMADRFTARGYATTWDVVEGDPAQRINEVSEEVQANLIALATHGYSGLKRLTIGSVAEEVLNKAKRPIILVRPEETHGATE